MNNPYSIAYNPPAPIVQMLFGAPGTRSTYGPYDALIDTGADITVMPKAMLVASESPSLSVAQLRSPWGEIHEMVIYLVELQIETIHLVGIQVAAAETGDDIILGRNVLNKLPLFLDGPKQYTMILDEAIVQRLRARQR